MSHMAVLYRLCFELMWGLQSHRDSSLANRQWMYLFDNVVWCLPVSNARARTNDFPQIDCTPLSDKIMSLQRLTKESSLQYFTLHFDPLLNITTDIWKCSKVTYSHIVVACPTYACSPLWQISLKHFYNLWLNHPQQARPSWWYLYILVIIPSEGIWLIYKHDPWGREAPDGERVPLKVRVEKREMGNRKMEVRNEWNSC